MKPYIMKKLTLKKRIILLSALAAGGIATGADCPGWSFSGGKMNYSADSSGNRIPDFSKVGYLNGDAPLPRVPELVTIEASSDGRDESGIIQWAIDQLAKMPLDRNVIVFPAA